MSLPAQYPAARSVVQRELGDPTLNHERQALAAGGPGENPQRLAAHVVA